MRSTGRQTRRWPSYGSRSPNRTRGDLILLAPAAPATGGVTRARSTTGSPFRLTNSIVITGRNGYKRSFGVLRPRRGTSGGGPDALQDADGGKVRDQGAAPELMKGGGTGPGTGMSVKLAATFTMA